jgi:hypothetical protein
MTLQDDAERRRYFRFTDEVILNCTRISPADLIQDTAEGRVMDAYDLSTRLASISQESAMLLRRVEKLEPVLAEYLQRLEKKIEAISTFLLDQDAGQEDTQPRTVSLSASGIRFADDYPWASGEVMALRLILLPERIGLRLYGRVVSADSTPTPDQSQQAVSVDFLGISDLEREILIAHLLKVERRHLRQTHP